MELKSLLDYNHWEDSELSYRESIIKSDLEKKLEPKLMMLYRQHKKNLLSNFAILLLTILIWAINPTADFLVPVGIILICTLFILLSTLYQFFYLKKPDQSNDIKTVLEATLTYDKALYKWQCRFFSILVSGFTLGGFLMGLIFSGAQLKSIFSDSTTLLVMTGSTVGMFFLSKTKAFRRVNRSMNPHYFKTKRFIEEQLNEINNKK